MSVSGSHSASRSEGIYPETSEEQSTFGGFPSKLLQCHELISSRYLLSPGQEVEKFSSAVLRVFRLEQSSNSIAAGTKSLTLTLTSPGHLETQSEKKRHNHRPRLPSNRHCSNSCDPISCFAVFSFASQLSRVLKLTSLTYLEIDRRLA